MPTLVNGSPTHALIVHAVAVLLPLSVLGALVLVFVPGARRAFGLLTVAIAFVACLAVPLAFASGGALRARVPSSNLIRHHVALAHQLLPVAALFGLALAAFVFVDALGRERRGDLNVVEAAVVSRLTGGRGIAAHRDARRDAPGPRRVAGTVLVVVALVTAVAVARAGDSGAKAAWDGRLLPAGTSHAER